MSPIRSFKVCHFLFIIMTGPVSGCSSLALFDYTKNVQPDATLIQKGDIVNIKTARHFYQEVVVTENNRSQLTIG